MVNEIRNSEDLKKAELLPGDRIYLKFERDDGVICVTYCTYEGEWQKQADKSSGITISEFHIKGFIPSRILKMFWVPIRSISVIERFAIATD